MKPGPGAAVAQSITGIILAGGRGQRLDNQDKGLIPLSGETLFAHATARLYPQASPIIVSANRHLATYATSGWPVVTDRFPGYAGPLAGIYSAMLAAETDYVVTVPCDAPLFPLDLVSRLSSGLGNADIALAHDGTRIQPLFALIPRGLAPGLGAYLQAGGRRVRDWMNIHRRATVDFSDQKAAFQNINTWQEYRAVDDSLMRRVSGHHSFGDSRRVS